MPPSPANPWQALLTAAGGGPPSAPVRGRLLTKKGRPWLLLPLDAKLARSALALYPAQSLKARLAKVGLEFCLALGFCPGSQPLDLTVAAASPFAQFLQTTVGSAHFPQLASLAGNPATLGQRHIFLLFDAAGSPQCVVKVGAGNPAVELIRAETQALRALAGRAGVPVLRAEFAAGSLAAFALDFYPGVAPAPPCEMALAALLTAWIQPTRPVPLRRFPAFAQLDQLRPTHPALAPLLDQLAAALVQPVIMHGDFAPWNVKVSPPDGSWLALDWERGEQNGVPGWDWFHFVLQPELLVQRRAPELVVPKLLQLLKSPAFQTYATATKIVGLERALLCAYLAYFAHVIHPSEGRAELEKILTLLLADHRAAP